MRRGAEAGHPHSPHPRPLTPSPSKGPPSGPAHPNLPRLSRHAVTDTSPFPRTPPIPYPTPMPTHARITLMPSLSEHHPQSAGEPLTLRLSKGEPGGGSRRGLPSLRCGSRACPCLCRHAVTPNLPKVWVQSLPLPLPSRSDPCLPKVWVQSLPLPLPSRSDPWLFRTPLFRPLSISATPRHSFCAPSLRLSSPICGPRFQPATAKRPPSCTPSPALTQSIQFQAAPILVYNDSQICTATDQARRSRKKASGRIESTPIPQAEPPVGAGLQPSLSLPAVANPAAFRYTECTLQA